MPRFAVAQGWRPNGDVKVRPVDNFSWSSQQGCKRYRTRREVKADSVNGHFEVRPLSRALFGQHVALAQVPVAVKHDHLDDLLAAMRRYHAVTREACVLRQSGGNSPPPFLLHPRVAGAQPSAGRH